MHELTNQIVHILKSEHDKFKIYTSFDGIPVAKKSGNLFVVVSQEKMIFDSVVPDGGQGIALFHADFRIFVLASMTTTGENIQEFFDTVIISRMHQAGCMLDNMQTSTVKTDLKLQKLVYSGLFHLHGVYIPDTNPEVEA